MKRILILSCNTGQGHNSAGLAVKEAFERAGAACEFLDALSFARKRSSALISRGYVGIATHAPQAFGLLYRAGGCISSCKRKSPVYLANRFYGRALRDYIESGRFDAVVMPHLFPAETLTHLRRHGFAVPFYNIATDYTCVPFWEETDPDCFFIPHERLRAEFLDKGVPPEKLIVTGIPVSARFNVKLEREAARARLGLAADSTVFLAMTGSMGFGDVAELAQALAAHAPEKADVLMLTGTNEALKARIDTLTQSDGRIRAVPFTRDVATYMDACDVLLSKPGGLTSTEAAVKNVPLVHTRPIPGCETKNARFFETLGLSVHAESYAEAAVMALSLVRNPAARERMLAAQRREISPHAADTIAHYVLTH